MTSFTHGGGRGPGGDRMYQSAQAAITKYNKISQTGQLKQQNFRQFWRLEVQNYISSRVVFSRGLPPWSVDDCLLTVPSHGHPTVRVPPCSVSKFPLLKRTPVTLDQSLKLRPHFNLTAPLKDTSPIQSNAEKLKVKASTWDFGEHTL